MTTHPSTNNTGANILELLATDVKTQQSVAAPLGRQADKVLKSLLGTLPFSTSGQLGGGFAGEFGVLLLLGGRFSFFWLFRLWSGGVALVCI